MAGIVRKSLVDQVYEQLREDIVSHKIGWGERLNVNELQERFDLSCTPIREAINRLRKEGFVKYKNNIGASVIDIGEKDIIEIQQVAMALDSAAVRYAMESGENKLIAQELFMYMERYKRAQNEDIRSNCIEKFIEVFYKHAHNSRLVDISNSIKGQQSMLRGTYAQEKKDESSVEDQIKIYNAVLSGNIQAAIDAIEKNYERGTKILLKVIHSGDKK